MTKKDANTESYLYSIKINENVDKYLEEIENTLIELIKFEALHNILTFVNISKDSKNLIFSSQKIIFIYDIEENEIKKEIEIKDSFDYFILSNDERSIFILDSFHQNINRIFIQNQLT